MLRAHVEEPWRLGLGNPIQHRGTACPSDRDRRGRVEDPGPAWAGPAWGEGRPSRPMLSRTRSSSLWTCGTPVGDIAFDAAKVWLLPLGGAKQLGLSSHHALQEGHVWVRGRPSRDRGAGFIAEVRFVGGRAGPAGRGMPFGARCCRRRRLRRLSAGPGPGPARWPCDLPPARTPVVNVHRLLGQTASRTDGLPDGRSTPARHEENERRHLTLRIRAGRRRSPGSDPRVSPRGGLGPAARCCARSSSPAASRRHDRLQG